MQEEFSPPCDIAALVPLLELRNRIGRVYGSEDIAMLLYTLVRRERPASILELGTGLGVSALWMGQAARENGHGQVWTLDDGSHWTEAAKLQAAIAPLAEVDPFAAMDFPSLDFPLFVACMIDLLELRRQVTFQKAHLDFAKEAAFTAETYPFLAKPIDLVFADIKRTPDEILDTLTALLPHLSEASSIFFDSASTSLTSYLFLEKLVEQLNNGKVPRRFLAGPSPRRRQALIELVARRKFTLVHLIERVKRPQNSTAWLKIEPIDYMPHPQALMKWV